MGDATYPLPQDALLGACHVAHCKSSCGQFFVRNNLPSSGAGNYSLVATG